MARPRKNAPAIEAAPPPERLYQKLARDLFSDLVAGREPGRRDDREVTIYKSVGVGLQDIALAGLAPQCAAQGIKVIVDAARSLVVEADREALRRTLLNLVLNAVDAMPAGGDLVLTAVDCRNYVEIEVADSGAGLSDEARRRAFEPFFTTKASGIGLGLAIVQRLMEAHGGGITVCNCPDGGAAFTVRLPRRAARLEAAA